MKYKCVLKKSVTMNIGIDESDVNKVEGSAGNYYILIMYKSVSQKITH